MAGWNPGDGIIVGTHMAFAALVDDGRVVTWGHKGCGGDSSSVQNELQQVKSIYANQNSFAALLDNGTVVTWGSARLSDSVKHELKQVHSVFANFGAFAVLRRDGSVITWGKEACGGDSSSVQHKLKQVQRIHAFDSTFVAVLADGTQVCWGSQVDHDLTQAQSVHSNRSACAVLFEDGTVKTWDHKDLGGDSSLVKDKLKQVQSIQSTGSAFAALLGDGTVVSWGHKSFGGDSSLVESKLKQVRSIHASEYAFAAVLSDGSVVSWGPPVGDSASVQSLLKQVKSITSNRGAFAALCDNGMVVTWGIKDMGGDSSSVQHKLKDIQAIYSNHDMFVAVVADGTVVTWGNKDYGDHSSAPESLRVVLDLDFKAPEAGKARLPNCHVVLKSRNVWIGVIKGPKGSPYCGGVFKVEIVLSRVKARAKFKPPIHHCNVDERTGEVAFPKNMVGMGAAEILCTISDLLVSPASAPNQNELAVKLFRFDRATYDLLARKNASMFHLAALDADLKLIPGILDLFLPPPEMSRRAQLQVFRKVALRELEQNTASMPSVTPHIENLELEHAFTDFYTQKADLAVAQLKLDIDQAVNELTLYATVSKQQFETKMQFLEQELAGSYLRERVAVATQAGAAPIAFRPSVKCMEEMITEARQENGRLSTLMNICMKKQKALFARFSRLQAIEEQKANGLAQAVDDEVHFFVAQAKHLEPSFRLILRVLVDKFNQGVLPETLAEESVPGLFTELRLTSGRHAKVLFAPQKTVERVKQKIDSGKACNVLDYLRATIVMADPALLAMFYRALQLDSNFVIKRVKNKLLLEDLDQPPNVHINLEFCGHIGEIQLILEDFLLIKEYSHKPFELTRIGWVNGAMVKGKALEDAVKHVVSTGVYVSHPGFEEF